MASSSSVSSVTAVILNWNSFNQTKTCLRSFTEGNTCGRIIVVDNNSQDGSAQRLQSEVQGPEYILNSQNDGFARGCNIGIKRALEDQSCKYVLLINNDAYLKRDCLTYAINHLESRPNAGIVGGKILTSEHSNRIWTAGGRLDLLRGQAVSRGVQQLDHGQFDRPARVSFVTCALALVRRIVFEEAGTIPDEYFFGQEEWDFSLSIKKAGFELWYEPQFVCYHSGDGSHSNADPAFIYNSYRNKLIFQQKHLPPTAWHLWLLAFEQIYAHLFAERHLARIHCASTRKREYYLALLTAISDHKRLGIRHIVEQDLAAFRVRLDSLLASGH